MSPLNLNYGPAGLLASQAASTSFPLFPQMFYTLPFTTPTAVISPPLDPNANQKIAEEITPLQNSAPSSPENDSESRGVTVYKGMRVKRGRPQQEIADDEEDPGSQKRKHRRLYARQYRAQMRNKIDEVKKLQDELEAAKKKHQDEVAQLNR
ncbi:unnamed protein product, partial [Mesorhabditis spiculigera]